MLKVLFVLLRYLNLCPDYFSHVRKQFDMKAKVNFKINDFTVWTTNNCNTHTVKAIRQPGNKIWSVNKIYYEKLNIT